MVPADWPVAALSAGCIGGWLQMKHRGWYLRQLAISRCLIFRPRVKHLLVYTPWIWSQERSAGISLETRRCAEVACEYGLSAAPLATNDIVITGSMDGYLEIYRASDGKRLWSFDAWRKFESINDQPAQGGCV